MTDLSQLTDALGTLSVEIETARDAVANMGSSTMTDLTVTGVLKVDPITNPPGRYMLRVDGTQVRVNGGEGDNPFSVNARGVPGQQQFNVGYRAVYIKGPYSDATPTIDSHGQPTGEDGQVLVNMTPTDWHDGASRDLRSTLACRADLQGSAFFIFDMPGNEVLHIRLDGLHLFAPDNFTGVPSSIWAADRLLLGVSGDLPDPTAEHRGELRRIEGGPGDVDQLYVCVKDADDTYVWRQI